MSKAMRRTVFFFVVAVLLGSVALMAIRAARNSEKEGPPEQKKLPVTAVILTPTDFTVSGEYHGQLSAISDVVVTAKAGGTILEDLIVEGDNVEKDTPLYRLEDDSYRYAMNQAEAALDLAREKKLQVNDFSRPELIRRLEAVLSEAETALKKADADADRFRKLHTEGAVPLTRKEGADLALASAATRVEVARENLAQARTGSRAEEKAAADAAVRQAEAAWKLARHTWENTVIRSPLSGIVASKTVFTGDTVHAGSAVAEIVDLSAFKVNLGVTADDAPFFAAGEDVSVTPRGWDRALPAKVKNSGIKADSRTGAFPVILHLASPGADSDNLLRAGTDVTVRFIKESVPSALVIPKAAIIRQTNAEFVFIVEEDVARRRAVTTGPEAESKTVVTAGLTEGELLVVVGQQRLRDGDRIELSVEK